MKSQAFEVFWRHLRNLDKSPNGDNWGSSQRYILNINPEGVLLREAHDIMDELRMMRRIYDQQLGVVTDFFKHLKDLHDQGNPPHHEFLQDLKKLLQDVNNKSNVTPHHDTTGNGEAEPENRTVEKSFNETTMLREANFQNCSANGRDKSHGEESSELKISIPKSTLDRAQTLIQWITMRRDELQDYEDTTKDVSNQVRHSSHLAIFDCPRKTLFTPQTIC
jgi:hypothetical protein